MVRRREKPIPPKGRELVRAAVIHGKVRPRGAGEASSLRALVRRGLLENSGTPTDVARLWADHHPRAA